MLSRLAACASDAVYSCTVGQSDLGCRKRTGEGGHRFGASLYRPS